MIADMLERTASVDPGRVRPGAGVVLLVDHVVRAGHAARLVLSGTGLDAVQLTAPGLQVTAGQELVVVRAVRRLLGEVGGEVGSRYTASTFGVLGWAIVSSRTVGEAVEVALRYLDLSHAFTRPSVEVLDGRLVGAVDAGHLPPDVRRFLLERDTMAMASVLDSLVPGGVGVEVEVGELRAVLRLDAAELDRPLPTVDAGRRDVAESLCRQIVDPRRRRSGLTEEVRVLITQVVAQGAPMARVASALGVTERTLRRRLREEGTSYRELVDEVRAGLAEALLTSSRTIPIEEVGVRLGFSGATSFIAAHRRWTGRTPRGGATASRRTCPRNPRTVH